VLYYLSPPPPPTPPPPQALLRKDCVILSQRTKVNFYWRPTTLDDHRHNRFLRVYDPSATFASALSFTPFTRSAAPRARFLSGKDPPISSSCTETSPSQMLGPKVTSSFGPFPIADFRGRHARCTKPALEWWSLFSTNELLDLAGLLSLPDKLFLAFSSRTEAGEVRFLSVLIKENFSARGSSDSPPRGQYPVGPFTPLFYPGQRA